MQFYLFGGAETGQGQAPILKKLIQNAINEIKPKQLLHIPYSRIKVPQQEIDIWGDGWVKKDLDLTDIELLDARNPDDLNKAKNPAIFTNGGPQHDNLYEHINENPKLKNLILNAKYYIGESAGAMMTAEYRRTWNPQTEKYDVKPGLGILKDTIIEAHYVARSGQELLRENVKKTGVTWGLGIDSITGLKFDSDKFPDKYEVIGDGLVEIINKNTL